MPQENNKFKIILLSVFGLLTIVGLVVFATYRSSGNKTAQVDISVWGTMDKTLFNTFVQQYNQDYAVALKVKYEEKDISTIDAELVEAIAVGSGPDVILIPQDLEKRYLDKVYQMTSIPVRTVQDTYIQEAELYLQASGTFALPFAVDPMVMYWNKDLFSSAGIANPPKTWAEFPLLVGELTKSDSNANIKQSLASLGEYRNINNAKELISTLIMQAGSSIVEGDAYGNYKSTLYSSVSGQSMVPAVSAMNFYTEYANPKKTVYSWNRSLPSSKQFFLAENLALYFGFASEYNDIKQKNPNLNFDVAMMPQTVDAKNKVTFGRMYGFSLMKSSPNIVQAYQMISLLTGKQAATVFAKVSDFAPVRRDLISEGTKDSVKTIFYSSALISRAWLDPDMVKTDAIFKNMVENITTGRSDAGGAVQDASGEIDNLL